MAGTTVKAPKKVEKAKPVTVETVVKKEQAKPTTKSQAVKEKKVVYTPTQYNLTDIVTVRNGFQGSLFYKSKKTGEEFNWEGFGDEQDMEIGELKNARNSAKQFFINNWFQIDDPDVLEYLGVSEYYKNSISIDEFNTLFEKPTDDILKIVTKLPDGQKQSVGYLAKRLVAQGGIDSNKLIDGLEEILGIHLRPVD